MGFPWAKASWWAYFYTTFLWGKGHPVLIRVAVDNIFLDGRIFFIVLFFL